MTETLSDWERSELVGARGEPVLPVARKALRIIDAHAADRAALVAQLEAANIKLAQVAAWLETPGRDEGERMFVELRAILGAPEPTHAALVAQVAELTRERDEARELARNAQFALAKAEEPIPDPDVGGWQIRAVTLRDTLAELNDANAEVTRLTRERDGAVTRLTEALAEAEIESGKWHCHYDAQVTRAEAAEARARELTEALAAAERLASSRLKSFTDAYESNQYLKATVADKDIAFDIAFKRANAAEARVRELEAENKRIGDACQSNYERIQALETLLAASEARAAQWQADAESYRADATVAQDRLAALQVRYKLADKLLSDWSNFDFDCPEEDEGDEDGAALERLYQRTGDYFRG